MRILYTRGILLAVVLKIICKQIAMSVPHNDVDLLLFFAKSFLFLQK